MHLVAFCILILLRYPIHAYQSMQLNNHDLDSFQILGERNRISCRDRKRRSESKKKSFTGAMYAKTISSTTTG
jgi:hypothetical protein